MKYLFFLENGNALAIIHIEINEVFFGNENAHNHQSLI